MPASIIDAIETPRHASITRSTKRKADAVIPSQSSTANMPPSADNGTRTGHAQSHIAKRMKIKANGAALLPTSEDSNTNSMDLGALSTVANQKSQDRAAARITRIEASLCSMQSTLDAVNGRFEDPRLTVDDVYVAVQDVTYDVDKTFGDMDDRVERIEQRIEEMDTSILDIGEKVDRILIALSRPDPVIASSIAALSKRIMDLQDRVESASAYQVTVNYR